MLSSISLDDPAWTVQISRVPWQRLVIGVRMEVFRHPYFHYGPGLRDSPDGFQLVRALSYPRAGP